MPRRARAMVVLAAFTAALWAAGCAPAASLLSDPREILDRAATNLGQATSVHVDIAVEGAVVLGAIIPGLPLGGGGGTAPGGGALSLTGTHADGTLDLAGERADLHLQVPALLGLTAELREVDRVTYVTSSLTGKGWHRLDAGSGLPIGDWRPMAWVDSLRAWIREPGVIPTRLDDASCPAGTCYVVRLVLDASTLSGGAPLASAGLDLPVSHVTLELRIDRSSLRLSEVVVTPDLGSAGQLRATVDLTAWDAAVTVDPPPSGDVSSGPLLP